jgi:hypothetical protein
MKTLQCTVGTKNINDIQNILCNLIALCTKIYSNKKNSRRILDDKKENYNKKP